jgi:hypothetical protein
MNMGRIILIMTVIGVCVLIPISSSAVGLPSHGSDIQNENSALTKPFAKVSLFIDGYTANRYLRIKSPHSFNSADALAAPYKLLVSKPENKTPLWEAYSMMLASLSLMGIIAYRRLTSEVI